MKENQVSLTSIMTAYIRGYHATYDSPKIFDDTLAYQLIPEERRTLIEQGLSSALKQQSSSEQPAALRFFLQSMGLPQVVSRSKFTEETVEKVVEQGLEQYVILGAGMDTFAFRHPELLKKIRVFEVDHPATQTFKRNRLAELGWETPPNLQFVPVDFSKESLAEAFNGVSYDPKAASIFSWLGVTMYLSRDEVFATLRSITEIAPTGSLIIFDYFEALTAARSAQKIQEELKKIGEPIKTGFDPSTLASDLAKIGIRLIENLRPADIQNRYFNGRTDGYHASEQVHFALAMVE